ncbi:hypothetical protein FISHEDRAFT_38881 [Fistulina hepatica ATCC 64428]|uniref:RING-CH-type domain-containing protein n=1 Tax=Fistulina hepatica ATCC 64428 TaxID=1128425 RepID=A0A0D7AGI9_9AGAR|nr:hypothetical protein FISHEDRAFT_38881 [Fistulina hepatica ATCC 64428]
MPAVDAEKQQPAPNAQEDDGPQCRICLDGADADPALGRLIRPCRCKGSMSYVHLGCLERWRLSSTDRSAFYKCQQCGYHYRYSRTRIAAIARNPLVVGSLSAVAFTTLVILSSFVTTFFMSSLINDEDNLSGIYFYWSPYSVGRELVRAMLRILQEGELADVLDEMHFTERLSSFGRHRKPNYSPPGILSSLIRRFLLGLPIIGAGSLVQMMLTMPVMGPLHWIARYRGNRRARDERGRDIATIVVVGLVLLGTFRAFYEVYLYIRSLIDRALARAGDAILEPTF